MKKNIEKSDTKLKTEISIFKILKLYMFHSKIKNR